MNSSRVASFSNAPLKSEVVVTEFCFCTPRIIMHMCWASMTTATPRGLSVFCIQFFMSFVSLSCTWSLLEKASTTRGDVSVRDIGHVGMSDEREHVVFT